MSDSDSESGPYNSTLSWTGEGDNARLNIDWFDGDKDEMTMTPESAQEIMNVIMGDGSEVEFDDQGKPRLNGIGPLTRIMDDLYKKITLDREIVLGFFWKDLFAFLGASRVEDKKALVDLYYESPYGQMCCGDVGPEVEICEENRTSISALHRGQGERQLGKFLLCRTITPAVNGVWLEVVVEDPRGDSGVLLLTNFTPSKYSKDVGNSGGNTESGGQGSILGILPPGSLILVKNLYALPRVPKLAPRPCSSFLLVMCCHNPADVIILSRTRMMCSFPGLPWLGAIPRESIWDIVLAQKTDPQIFEALKRKGNEAFVFKRYTDALRCYDLALDNVTGDGDADQLAAVWSNKAASFLGLGCFQKGLECSDKALLRDPNHVKAIYRKAKALVGLGRGSDALAFINKKFEEEPSLVENEDLRSLSAKIPQPGVVLDFDDFVDFGVEGPGPIVHRPDPITGRGVFATADIPPGKGCMIHTQRSFATVDEVEEDTEEGRQLSETELVGLIANKIAFAPELGPEFYKLWAGMKLKKLEPNDPTINRVNILRIQTIVQHNSRYSPKKTGPPGLPRQAALWGITPFVCQLNHSCSEANIIIHHQKNWSFILASKPIKEGDEICSQWIDITESLEWRRGALGQLGMVCNCRMCRRDAQDNVEVKRKFKKLWARFNKFSPRDYETNSHKVDSALGIIHQVATLRQDAPHINGAMIHPSVASLFAALVNRERYVEAVDLGKKVVAVAETCNNLNMILAVGSNVMRGYLKLKKLEEAREWAQKLKEYTLILYGISGDQFTWGQAVLDVMNEAGLDPATL